MKYDGCPVCDEVFETVGFRPMTFQCPHFNTVGQWYAGELDGEPRGFIDWSPCIDYIDNIMWPYLYRILSSFDSFCNQIKDAQLKIHDTLKSFMNYCERCQEYLLSQISGGEGDLQIEMRIMMIYMVYVLFVEVTESFLMTFAELATLAGAIYSMIGYSLVTLRDLWIIAGDVEDDLSSDETQDVKKENQKDIEQGFKELYSQSVQYYNILVLYISVINMKWKIIVRKFASEIEELANFGPFPPFNPFRYY